ncbi:type II secretion system major pseudopilin GspG [Sphingomicrobium sediminis]|uniref:Type II secretion system core protein G n=1 Tax=Sphingomicrobium sediminis TaxID=2950949 RepID=A0A9X2EIM9_9SPHN|nr:type II secretion system major pseudopilin GspG [Sphingomicrobium sediminis]MCM8558201.1 type II secretion system major pseudopilin GspG [Sphingomicrobium sediminis]
MTSKTQPKRRKKNGFTLVELMVVIVIIGLLGTVVMLNVLPAQDQAQRTAAQANISQLENAMEQYRIDNFTYPTSIEALKTPPADLAQPDRYRPGGYVRDIPEDPWGRPFQIQVPGRDGRPFDIYSLGADGQPGGENENADIYAP